MNHTLDRRDFLAGAAGTVAAAALAAPADAARPFSFLVLGDTHFDKLDHHDMTWLEKDHHGDVAQVRRYSRHTADLLPKLLRAVRSKVRDGGAEFVVHVGDLVEGLCGTPPLARRQCEEVVDLLNRADLGAPLLLTKGNHDVTGPGAADAYKQILLPYLSKQSGEPLTTARYAVERHGCLFVLYDCYDREALGWLEKTLANRTARHVFVVVHQPIVPFQARSSWSVLIQPRQAAERARLLNLLGQHHAIVLVGHVHRYGVVTRDTDRGRFAQVALCSILSAADERPREERAGLSKYGPDLVELEPNFQPETKDERRKLLTAEAPLIKHFEYANVAGYARFVVSGGVEAEVYTGASERPWKTVNLSALL